MESDMIERVTLAIFKSTFHPDDAANEALVDAKRQEWPADWRRAGRAARAAVEAIREPTDAMARGAQATGMGLVTPAARKEMFIAMIDATLSPSSTQHEG